MFVVSIFYGDEKETMKGILVCECGNKYYVEMVEGKPPIFRKIKENET
jgi:hypothetical protein